MAYKRRRHSCNAIFLVTEEPHLFVGLTSIDPTTVAPSPGPPTSPTTLNYDVCGLSPAETTSPKTVTCPFNFTAGRYLIVQRLLPIPGVLRLDEVEVYLKGDFVCVDDSCLHASANPSDV